jgi:3',5'-cyclic AMP phosphodiesterase CpdA
VPTLLHLSDLHFGPAYLPELGETILKEIDELRPDAVVISGDFTMRARYREYAAARDYVKRITRPVLVIPGNHDQPIFQPVERLLMPFGRFQQYIQKDVDSTLGVGGLFIAGLNDNHPILPGGLWSRAQRDWLVAQLAHAPPHAFKVVATHHQLMWEGKARPAGFWYPNRTLSFLERFGVELVLNGHTHIASAEQASRGIVVARAGTATSSRTRHGSANAYNLITVDDSRISVFVRRYDRNNHAFVAAQAFSFPRRPRSDSPG